MGLLVGRGRPPTQKQEQPPSSSLVTMMNTGSLLTGGIFQREGKKRDWDEMGGLQISQESHSVELIGDPMASLIVHTIKLQL